MILSEAHLRRVLKEYVTYFNRSRPHQGIDQRVPDPAKTQRATLETSSHSRFRVASIMRIVGWPDRGGGAATRAVGAGRQCDPKNGPLSLRINRVLGIAARHGAFRRVCASIDVDVA